MIRSWKSASVGMTVILAVAVLSLYAYTRAHAAPTYRLANGIEVTPETIQPNDVAKVLGIKTWKFDVSLPDTRQGLQLTLNLCQSGKNHSQRRRYRVHTDEGAAAKPFFYHTWPGSR